MIDGLNNRQIAMYLVISNSTVKIIMVDKCSIFSGDVSLSIIVGTTIFFGF
jgi:hypothetical protein